MSEVANANINTLLPGGQVAEKQPSEHVFAPDTEPIADTIAQNGTVGLLDEETDLRACVATLEGEITALKTKLAAMQMDLDLMAENSLIQLRLINELRQRRKPSKDKEKILRALLAANDGKMLSSAARRIMHMDKGDFSRLVAGINGITTKVYHLDRRQTVLILE